MLYWLVNSGLIVLVLCCCSIGAFLRRYAYHAGRGFGFGSKNAPPVFRLVPWWFLWLIGLMLSVGGADLAFLAVGRGRLWLFVLLFLAVAGVAAVLGKWMFRQLCGDQIEQAYHRLEDGDGL